MKKSLSVALLLSLFSSQVLAIDGISFTEPKISPLFQNEDVKYYEYIHYYDDGEDYDAIIITNNGDLKYIDANGNSKTLVSGEIIRSFRITKLNEIDTIQYITENGQVKYIQRNDERPISDLYQLEGMWTLTFDDSESQMSLKLAYQFELGDGTTGILVMDPSRNIATDSQGSSLVLTTMTYGKLSGSYQGRTFTATRNYD